MNDTVETNALWVLRALAGEADAFARLTERHRPMVFALCLQWMRNPTDAEDLTQETLLRAYSCLEQIREPERFGAWLAQIAINLCKNWGARVRQEALPLRVAEQQPKEEDVTQGIVLREAMAALSPELRQVIEWFYLDGFSQKEIALLWRLPQSTVKGRLDASRLRLRKEFQKMGLLPAEVIEEAVPTSRVALTDTNREETKALRVALKAAGFACTVLKPEEMLLPRLRRLQPEIFILNAPFGTLDENDILRAIRADHRLRQTAVMFLTPREDDASIFKAWKNGVDVYLTNRRPERPFKVTEAVSLVERIDRSFKAQDYMGLAIEYAWRRQTEAALRCLEAIDQELLPANAIRTEVAFNSLHQEPRFGALLAKLPSEEEIAEAERKRAEFERELQRKAEEGTPPV